MLAKLAKIVVLAALIPLLAVALFAPSVRTVAQEKKADVQELRVVDLASWHTPFNLNPYQFGYSGSSDLIWLRMVGIDPKFQPINIGLTDSWTFNADRTSVTLKLKTGMKFRMVRPSPRRKQPGA